jgi:hypothetical protein
MILIHMRIASECQCLRLRLASEMVHLVLSEGDVLPPPAQQALEAMTEALDALMRHARGG